MLDEYISQISGIAGITVCGVSLATIIAMVIVVVREVSKARREGRLTKAAVETAFQNAVLPRTIKIDLSKKIEEPLKEGFAELQRMQKEALELQYRGIQLNLMILNEFSHVQKLPVEIQNEIEDYIDKSKSITVTLEE